MTFTDAPAPIDDYRKVLRKVGLVLIVVGLLDTGWMVYCIARWRSYSSSFSIFAVIAGILLVRGSLPTARVVALFSAFFLTSFAGIALLFPIMMRLPPDLVWLYVRLHALMATGFLLLVTALLVLLAWTYRTLTKPVVLTAMDQQQIDYRHWRYRPSSGFAAGGLLLAILIGSFGLYFSGVRSQVEEEARRKVGAGYRLWVSRVSVSSTSGGPTVVQAKVIAFRDREMKTVPVAFER
jgi:hypothetical protein